ncbi:MAG: peptidoglycan-binding domain-containing protein, partial [Frankiaceae bacterium]
RPDVRLYQLALDRLGFNLAADGRFGRLTALSTRHFQAAHGLAVDGEAGPQTKIALLRALAGQH